MTVHTVSKSAIARAERVAYLANLRDTLLDAANALSEVLPQDHHYRRIAEQAYRLLGARPDDLVDLGSVSKDTK